MIDAADLDAAKRLAADLRLRGDEHNAQVVEHLIAASRAAPVGPVVIRPPEYLTFRQAARALNVRIRTIKDWVATGKVRAVVADGQTLVDRSSLLAYLDGLHPSRAARMPRPADEATRRALVSLAYPGDVLQRLRELLDARLERGLSAEERAELDRLEEVAHRVSAARLREWLRQHEASALAGGDQEEGVGRPDPPER
jgi:hypothetical protein